MLSKKNEAFYTQEALDDLKSWFKIFYFLKW
jgi:hypothetical protein